MNTEEIIQGMLNVARANQEMMVADPNGDHPRCKPKVTVLGEERDGRCRHCGNIITVIARACPASDPKSRWRIDWSKA